jgi:hypothetical protein
MLGLLAGWQCKYWDCLQDGSVNTETACKTASHAAAVCAVPFSDRQLSGTWPLSHHACSSISQLCRHPAPTFCSILCLAMDDSSLPLLLLLPCSECLCWQGCDVLPYVASDQSAPFATHTPATYQCAPPRVPSTGCSSISSSSRAVCSSSQESSRVHTTSPDLAPLCLLRRLSGVNSGEEGTHTPQAAEADRCSPSSRCSSPADLSEPAAAVEAAAAGVAVTPSSVKASAAGRCACGSRWCRSSGTCCSSASKRASSAASTAAAAADNGEAAESELSEDEELQGGCVYVDQGWQGSAEAPVMHNPLFLLGSPGSSPQRVGPAVGL